MNYIKKLEKDLEQKTEDLQKIEVAINELKLYLLSEKFRCGSELDGYVNVQDVLHRLEEIGEIQEN